MSPSTGPPRSRHRQHAAARPSILVVLFFAAAGLSMLFDRRRAARGRRARPARMTDAATRYAHAQAQRAHPVTAAFAASQRFDLDPFQIAGCQALEDSRAFSSRLPPVQARRSCHKTNIYII